MTAKEVMKKLQENGWTLNRTNGSHHVFTKKGCRSVPVPLHGDKDLGNKGVQILKEAGIKDGGKE
jgi:predicted RNA binding protein YcfA (HicA-like mRNA interferase family)